MSKSNKTSPKRKRKFITLTGENGQDISFEYLDLVEYEGRKYVVLLPIEDSANEVIETVVVLERVTDHNGDNEYLGVDDDATLNAVFDIFREKFQD